MEATCNNRLRVVMVCRSDSVQHFSLLLAVFLCNRQGGFRLPRRRPTAASATQRDHQPTPRRLRHLATPTPSPSNQRLRLKLAWHQPLATASSGSLWAEALTSRSDGLSLNERCFIVCYR